MSNTRKFTVELLTRLELNHSYSNIALDKGLKRHGFDAQEKRFATALFYGTLERIVTLDRIIEWLSDSPNKRLPVNVRNILRTALYQLKFMDSVPDSAAVDEAVKLVKLTRHKGSVGFVNGLLREFIRRDKALPETDDPLDRLSVEYSCPMWLVEKWMKEYGEAACISLLKSSVGRSDTTLRVNTLRCDADSLSRALEAEGICVRAVEGFPDALRISGSGSVERSRAFIDGLFHVQDVSSQLCCSALDAKPGMTVLDLCASPGGKSFTVAEMMGDKGYILSSDLHSTRARLIQMGADRLGIHCITAGINDAKIFNHSFPQADRVLCDVPCSGLGVIGHKPEIKYKSPKEFERLPEVQYSILETSCRYLKPGGRLVYSTCTLSRAENDEVVDRFLASHPDFEPVALGGAFGQYAEDSRISIIPDMFGSDGFFAAAMIKREVSP